MVTRLGKKLHPEPCAVHGKIAQFNPDLFLQPLRQVKAAAAELFSEAQPLLGEALALLI
jgi:hypothetical protein